MRTTYELEILGSEGQVDWFRGTRRECFDYAIMTYEPKQSRQLLFHPVQEVRNANA